MIGFSSSLHFTQELLPDIFIWSDYLPHNSDFVGNFHLQQLLYPEPTNRHSLCLFPFVVSSAIFNQNHCSKILIRIRKNTHLLWLWVFHTGLNVSSVLSCAGNPLWLCPRSLKVFLIQVKMIPTSVPGLQCLSAFYSNSFHANTGN